MQINDGPDKAMRLAMVEVTPLLGGNSVPSAPEEKLECTGGYGVEPNLFTKSLAFSLAGPATCLHRKVT